MAAQLFGQREGRPGHVSEPMEVRAAHALGDRGHEIARGFLAEARQRGDPAFAAGGIQFGNAADPKFLVESFDLFRAEPADREQLKNARWERGFELVVISEFAGSDELGDLLGHGLPDALDLIEFAPGDRSVEVTRVSFNGAGGGLIGANLERVFALEVKQLGDAFERAGDDFLGHAFT